jgi:CheY-like chemotaxis protein
VGYDCQAAEDGPDGIEAALFWRPGEVVSGLALPVFNGFELDRRVRAALGRNLQLVVLTVFDDEETAHCAVQAGFDRHLTGPADLDELRRLLDCQAGLLRWPCRWSVPVGPATPVVGIGVLPAPDRRLGPRRDSVAEMTLFGRVTSWGCA